MWKFKHGVLTSKPHFSVRIIFKKGKVVGMQLEARASVRNVEAVDNSSEYHLQKTCTYAISSNM